MQKHHNRPLGLNYIIFIYYIIICCYVFLNKLIG